MNRDTTLQYLWSETTRPDHQRTTGETDGPSQPYVQTPSGTLFPPSSATPFLSPPSPPSRPMPSNGVLRDGLTPPPPQFPQPAPSAAHIELKLLDLSRRLLVQCCFTSTETIRRIRDGKPRTATSTFTQLLNSVITTTTKTLPLTNGRD